MLFRHTKDLSDMSENDKSRKSSSSSSSSSSLSSSSSESDDEGGRRKKKHSDKKKQKKQLSLADSGCQTDMVDAMRLSSVIAAPSLSASLTLPADLESALSEKILVPEDSDETEATADPKFDLRPADIEVAEGDCATFKCRVSGTQPIGELVF